MQGKKIIFPGIVVFDYNIGQTFCGTNSQKNGPKIGSGFPRDDVKNQDDSMAGFKTRVEIFAYFDWQKLRTEGISLSIRNSRLCSLLVGKESYFTASATDTWRRCLSWRILRRRLRFHQLRTPSSRTNLCLTESFSHGALNFLQNSP